MRLFLSSNHDIIIGGDENLKKNNNKKTNHIVLLELVDGELGLHQVVVEDDDLSAQRPLFVVMVLRLTR